MIVQISVAAGVSWGIARYGLGHESPFLATVAAIICLGFSFGQRLGRVVEVAVGVTVGCGTGDGVVTTTGVAGTTGGPAVPLDCLATRSKYLPPSSMWVPASRISAVAPT